MMQLLLQGKKMVNKLLLTIVLEERKDPKVKDKLTFQKLRDKIYLCPLCPRTTKCPFW